MRLAVCKLGRQRNKNHHSTNRIRNLITVKQDATYSVYYIYVGSSTCFGC